MEERARFILLACANSEPLEFATAFIPLALASFLDDGVLKTLFRLGISYHQPVELPDTSNLNWEETVTQCLGGLQSQAGGPSSTPLPPLAPSSSPLPPLAPSSSPMAPLAPSSSPLPPLAPSSSPMPPLVPSSSPMPPLAPSSSPMPPLAPSS